MNNKNLPVGYIHDLPSGMNLFAEYGGYKFAYDSTGFHICGVQILNITLASIVPCSIMPVNKEYFSIKQIDTPFIIEEDIEYYFVTYHNFRYIFKDLSEAFNFIGTIIQYKKDGLMAERYGENI